MSWRRARRAFKALCAAWAFPHSRVPTVSGTSPMQPFLNRMFTANRKKSVPGQPAGAPPRPVDGYRPPIRGIRSALSAMWECGWKNEIGAVAREGHRPGGTVHGA